MSEQRSPAMTGEQLPETSSGIVEHYSEADALGAIRLAMAAGADRGVRAVVVDEILKRAPMTDPANVSSVGLLIQAVRAAKAEFRVTDHEPKGRLARL